MRVHVQQWRLQQQLAAAHPRQRVTRGGPQIRTRVACVQSLNAQLAALGALPEVVGVHADAKSLFAPASSLPPAPLVRWAAVELPKARRARVHAACACASRACSLHHHFALRCARGVVVVTCMSLCARSGMCLRRVARRPRLRQR